LGRYRFYYFGGGFGFGNLIVDWLTFGKMRRWQV
jgi:hypothetical protein